jgi:tRNA pseudouridine38-40 synthase
MRYFIEIAYKGTHYAGWQIQENASSVQEKVEYALSTILREPVRITGSGRTDTGVHASQQFAHFNTEKPLHSQMLRAWNALLPKDISILGIYEVSENAHTRFDALKRTYQYKIVTQKNPYLENLALLESRTLDVDSMEQAAQKLLLYEDFESFSKVKANAKTSKCKIYEAFWFETLEPFSNHKMLVFQISANRFLWGMVRAIVGTLLEVGRGKINISDFEQIIKARDRSKAAAAASPDGLYLCKVEYPYLLKKL